MKLPFRLPRIKLRIKFIVFSVALAALPLLFVMLLVINRLQTIQRENAINVNKQLAQAAAKEIEKFILSQYDILKQIDIVYAQKDIGEEAQGALVERFLFLNESFTDITILDEYGQEKIRKNLLQVFTADDLKSRANSPEFTVVRESQYYFSPFSIKNGKPSFTIGIPLIGTDGSFQGAVLAVVDARVMEHIIKKISVVEKKGKAYIVNEEGIVIAHPNISLVFSQADFSFYPPVKQVVFQNAGVEPFDIYTNEDNQDVLGTGFPITIPNNALAWESGQTNWSIIVEQPAATVLAQVNIITRFALITLSAVLVLATLISLLFVRRIVGPIERVHAAFLQIGAHDLNHRISIHTNDEIEDLANGFNAMAENLEEAFRKLEQDKNIIEVTLASIVDAVIAVDAGRKIVVFNTASERLLGTKRSDVLGKPIDQIIRVFLKDEDLAPSVYCPDYTAGGEIAAFNKYGLKIVSHTGKKVFVNLIVGRITENANMNLGYILSLHDVTKEKEFEQMKLDFVSMAAHELRTPLTSIKGYLSLLRNGQLTPEEGKQFLSRINISADRLGALVENILNVSKIENGVLTMNTKSVNWNETIKEVMFDLKDRAKDRNIQMNFHEPETPLPNVLAEKLRISEVLINLINNAINYTEPGGHVEIWTEQKGREIITHIKDDGQGIPKEALTHLFTKFFRVSGILEQGSKGTGLGLYIAKAIVDNHNGNIWVESEENKGSVFSFSLPVA